MEQAPIAAKPATPKAVPAPAPPVADASGNLIASGERIAWLELPRGLTRVGTARGVEHLFQAKGIPIDRIQAFFGARLIAADTRRQGKDGVVLSRAVPSSGVQPKQSTLDVSVLAGSTRDEVLVRIYERYYVEPGKGISDADARSLLKQQMKRAE